MTNPENEFFEFLTTEENLKGLIIAKNQFPSVKETLIQNFWNNVLEKVTEGLQKHPEWEAKLQSNIWHHHTKLYIKLKHCHIYDTNHLPSIIFCFQRLGQYAPFIGFWINEQTTEYNKDAIKAYIASKHQEDFPEFKDFDDWWLVWDEMTNFNLSIDETLLLIIPTKAEEKAKEFSDRLWDLFERVKPHLDYINEKYKR